MGLKRGIVTVWKKTKQFFSNALNSNSSPKKLAASFALGVFIAFSPFPGGHTIMVFLAHWLFKLNFPVLFFATSINNPWTIIPFYAFDYSFGHWFVHSFLGWSPSWVISLEKIFGSGKICLWSFFIGGHVLGIIGGLLSYPIMLRVFQAGAARRAKSEDNYQEQAGISRL